MTALPSPRRVLRVDAVRNQERLLEAARSVFAVQGLDAPLEDVARRAGVGIATLYRRFPDRESLVAAMFESRVREMGELADAATDVEDPWDAFRAVLWAIFRMVAKDKGLRQLLMGSRYGLKGALDARAALINLMGRVIRRAQKDGRLRPEVTENDIPLLVLMIGAVADVGARTNSDLWERYATLLIDGLFTLSTRAQMSPDALSSSEISVLLSRT